MEGELKEKIKAILFYKGEEVKISELLKILEVAEGEVKDALSALSGELEGKGITLLKSGDKVALATNPEFSDLIESINKEELNKEIGNAGIETLSIILYKSPVSKAEIDYIRGVNSASILRNLQIRGLIEKDTKKSGVRSSLYKPSTDILSLLGVKDLKDLPAYEEAQKELKEFLKEKENE